MQTDKLTFNHFFLGGSFKQQFGYIKEGHFLEEGCLLYKYWLLMREIVQNNSPRWLETVGYYISRDEVEGNIGTRSPVNEESYFAQFPDYRAVNICFI